MVSQMELHIVIVELTHAVKTFKFTAWQDASFIADAAMKFQHRYVWWYRTAPDRPWMMRHRKGVSNKELGVEGCPFGLPVADRIAQSGAGEGTSSGGTRPASGARSKISGETGPGLEKP